MPDTGFLAVLAALLLLGPIVRIHVLRSRHVTGGSTPEPDSVLEQNAPSRMVDNRRLDDE